MENKTNTTEQRNESAESTNFANTESTLRDDVSSPDVGVFSAVGDKSSPDDNSSTILGNVSLNQDAFENSDVGNGEPSTADTEPVVEDNTVLKLKITNFDGPLDLLLELVKQNKIEIKDIFVSQVTEQFLQYIEQISDLDFDKAGEYMAMAATLIEIKAKQCIPVLASDENDEDSPEKVLIRQLEEYKVFKEVVSDLKECENVNRFYREPDKSVGKAVTVMKDNLSVEGFMQAFTKFLMKMQLKNQVDVSRTMQKETFSVAQKIRLLREILKEEDSFLFSKLFDENTGLNEYITTFLAVLELLKQQIIDIEQRELFDEILIKKRPDSDNIEVVLGDEYESIAEEEE